MANGSIASSLGLEDDDRRGSRFRRRARQRPQYSNFICDCCNNPRINKDIMERGKFRDAAGVYTHFKLLDGTAPPWLGKITLGLLTPSILFDELNESCRSIILASGTLAPVWSFASELGLKGFVEEKERHRLLDEGKYKPKDFGRLAIKPFPPLEADHTIDLEKQVRSL